MVVLAGGGLVLVAVLVGFSMAGGHVGALIHLSEFITIGGAALGAIILPSQVRPWTPHEIAMRMLNNLVVAYQRRSDVSAAIRAARLRLALPAEASMRDTLQAELRAMQAQLN